MENQPKLNSSKEVIAFLAERFPHCFSAEGEARPLKIGIFQDLVDRVAGEMNLSKTQLRSALRLYTSSWRYLYVLNPAQRVLILTATHAVSWTSNMSSMLASSLKKRKRVFRHSVLNSKRKNAKLPQLLVRKKTHRAANASHARPRHAAKKALNVNLVRKSR